MRHARAIADALPFHLNGPAIEGRVAQGLGLARQRSLGPTQTLWWDVIQLPENLRHQWLEMLHAVTLRFNDQNGNRQRREILLKLDVLIHCQEDIKPRSRKRKELAILDAGPSTSWNSFRLVPGQ